MEKMRATEHCLYGCTINLRGARYENIVKNTDKFSAAKLGLDDSRLAALVTINIIYRTKLILENYC